MNPILISGKDRSASDTKDPQRRSSIISTTAIVLDGKNEGDEFGPEAKKREKDHIQRSIDNGKRKRNENTDKRRNLLLIEEDDGDDDDYSSSEGR